MNPDYLMLGHITSDLLPDGATIPGGTSLYAARTAQRLGRRPGIVSAKATLPVDWPTDLRGVMPLLSIWGRFWPRHR